MKNIKKKGRNSSIELLRILSMFAIVIHHYAVHGTLNSDHYNPAILSTLRVNLFLHYLGKVGVCCFVIIGAYFLCEKRFNFRRPINLILTMMFYSFDIYLVLKYGFHTGIWGTDTFARTWLPFPLPSGYWFVYAYIVMLLAMPCLNIIINHLTQRKLLLLIVGLFILWSIIPAGIWMFGTKPDTSVEDFGYTYTTYFFLLYFVGAYLRKYRNKFWNSTWMTGLASVVSILIAILLTFLVNGQSSLYYYEDIAGTNGPIVLISAVFIFAFFRNIQLNSKIINYIAGSMFGVYLIHDNSFIRPLIWKKFISSAELAHSVSVYTIRGLEYSLLIFIGCILLDIVIRRLLFSKLIDWLTKVFTNLISKVVDRVLAK